MKLIENGLTHFLNEMNIDLSFLIENNIITSNDYSNAIESDNVDFISELRTKYIRFLNDEKFLIPSLKKFYNNYTDKFDGIIEKSIRNYSNTNNRLVLNTVKRFSELTDKTEKLGNAKSTYLVFHTIVCIEAIYNRVEITDKTKFQILMDFFNEYIAEEDKACLGSALKRHKEERLESIGYEGFCRLINEVRNRFVHEGDYYTFSFTRDIPMIVELEFPEDYDEYKMGYSSRIYQMDLKYERFKEIMMKGFCNFICNISQEI